MSIKPQKNLRLTIALSILLCTWTPAFAQEENTDQDNLNGDEIIQDEITPNDLENLDEANPTNTDSKAVPETLIEQPQTTTSNPNANIPNIKHPPPLTNLQPSPQLPMEI